MKNIRFIKLGTFFASKSQGGATPLPESVRGGRMSPCHPPVSAPVTHPLTLEIFSISIMEKVLESCSEITECFRILFENYETFRNIGNRGVGGLLFRGGSTICKFFWVPPLATVCPPLKTPFWKNIDTFFIFFAPSHLDLFCSP